MCAMPLLERRAHRRIPMTAAVSFHHAPSGRTFPARCVDASVGGLQMRAPANAPLQSGHAIEVTLDVSAGADQGVVDAFDKPAAPAEIVHVDRSQLASLGHILVRVKLARTKTVK